MSGFGRLFGTDDHSVAWSSGRGVPGPGPGAQKKVPVPRILVAYRHVATRSNGAICHGLYQRGGHTAHAAQFHLTGPVHQ